MSLQKVRYWKSRRNHDPLDNYIRKRYHNDQSNYLCQKTVQPKFNRARSQSKLSRLSHQQLQQKPKSFSTVKLYNKLNYQLKEIKETLKQQLISKSDVKKKKVPKYRDKVITQISEREPRYKYTRNYYDVLDHIAEIKSKNKGNKTENQRSKGHSQFNEEKTLFYGIDYIDSVEFKIKIKLTKTHYYLFAKNNHTKVMMEMSYSDYMKLHLGELRGNPCNIFRNLQLRGQQVEVAVRGFNSNGRSLPSLKSYVGYS